MRTLTIKGNHLYSAADIVKVTGLHLQQRVTAAILEAARNKLLATDLFNNVTDAYRYSGSPPEYDVTMEVAENDQLFPMAFERLPVSPDAIRQYLQKHVPLYSDQIPGTDIVLHRYAAAIQDFLGETKPGTKVRAQVSNEDPKQLTVCLPPMPLRPPLRA